jgi:hypothetical protein
MAHKTHTDWIDQISTSSAELEAWLVRMPQQRWHNQVEGNWKIKDLVGHLAAWSDLLTDQIEDLARGNFENLKHIEIDTWNAAQIEMRRDWPVAKIWQEWKQASHRTQNVIMQLPAEVYSQRWFVPWDEGQVAIYDLLDLWLLHLKQHKEAWEPAQH